MEYSLTDIASGQPGVARSLHGLAVRSPLRFIQRVAQVSWDVATTSLIDVVAPLHGEVLRQEAGRAKSIGAALGLYVHWSPSGRVSPMVLRQLMLWRQLGFDMIFISNAAVPPRDWDAVAEDVVLRIQRKNTGLDFGAWRDAAALAIAAYGVPQELLLTNDSVLGPFRPLAPMVEAWRGGGDGVFGMTESWGGGPHLQSYALLARGEAVRPVLDHLAGYRDHRSKWRVVRSGELGLSAKLGRGNAQRAALFGYQRLCAAVDFSTRSAFGPRFAQADAMLRYPLNPTHHLWRVLIEAMGFPYLKRELVLRNPGRLPGVDDWPALVPAAEASLIRGHLALMGG